MSNCELFVLEPSQRAVQYTTKIKSRMKSRPAVNEENASLF